MKDIKLLRVFLSLAILTVLCACGERKEENPQATFRVSVTDSEAASVPSANIYLYDFQAEEIVASGVTNRQGICTLFYMPEKDEDEKASIYYRDFMIYVDKEGYQQTSYSLTRYYGTEEKFDTDFSITLPSADEVPAQSMPDLEEEHNDLIADQGEKPFYVSRK